jgi:hypothetical protein
LNSLAYLDFGLYAMTIEVPAYGMYQLVNFGSSGVMLSLPTDSKTFGLISPDAMSDSSVPEALPVPEKLAPVAAVNAGFTTFSFRNWSELAYATLAVPDTVVLDALALADDAAAVAEDDVAAGAEDDEEEEDDDELQAAAVRPRHAMPSTAAIRLCDDRNVSMYSTLAIETCVTQ